MKKFKLYLIGRHNLCLSSFDIDNTTPQNGYGTYNESLSQSENDQYQLTFSMAQYVGFQQNYNYYLDLLPIGAQLRLVRDDSSWINFIITERSPQFLSGNLIYAFTAQDEVSFLWAKRGIGYSYSSFDEDGGTLHTIDFYGNRILRDNGLSGWHCVSKLSAITGKPISFEIESSNVYNALIELANTVNAKIKINYYTHIISFYDKQSKRFSGYRLYPEKNLKSLSMTNSGNELTTVLKCSGGEDKYGAAISIVPAIPDCVMNWLNKYRNQSCKIGSLTVSNSLFVSERLILGEASDIGNWESADSFKDNWYILIRDYILNHEEEGLFTTEKDTKEREQEIKELNNFTAVATEVPYLSQYLVDFSYFKNTNQLTESELEDIKKIFNVEMRKNNIDYKNTTSLYYRTEYQILSIMEEIWAVGEQYEALWMEYNSDYKNKNLNDYSVQANELKKKMEDIFLRNDKELIRLCNVMYGNLKDFELLNKYSKAAKENTNLALQVQEKMKKLQKKIQDLKDKGIEETSYEIMTLKSEYALIKKQFATYLTLSFSWSPNKDLDENYIFSDFRVSGLNDLIYNTFKEVLRKTTNTISYDKGLEQKLAEFKAIDDTLWTELLNKYGNYFYENSYENADELDSVSLYNQAVSYFYDINKPTANYNLQVLDLSALDLVGMPDLDVGNTIQVCDKRLRSSADCTLIKDNLIITGLKFDLRKPSSVSVDVEHYVPYQRILSKLIKTVSTK